MKRFLLFAGSVYYPAGGTHDLQKRFDTIEECKAYYQNNKERESVGNGRLY